MADLQVDKMIHIGMFSILTYLLNWGLYRYKKPEKTKVAYFVAAAVSALAYGIMMEYVQRDYIVNRSFDGGDIIADGIGSALGLTVSWYRLIKK